MSDRCRTVVMAGLCIVCLVAGAGVRADEAVGPSQPAKKVPDLSAAPGEKLGTWSAVLENDYFAGTDREYTNGIRFAYLRPKGRISDAGAWIGRNLLQADGRDGMYEGLALGQNLYTPSDITQSGPQVGDHPYAGWLYLELAAIADRGSSVDTLTTNLGIVGPLAMGEFVQNTFHQLIDSTIAQGWDNQLSNEPGVIFSFDRTWRFMHADTRSWGFDLLPSAGASLGNVLTQASAGLTVRLGPDLQDDLGPPRIRPSLAGGGFLDVEDHFDFYIFGGAQTRFVARNIFLDGNTFRNSISVNKRNIVHDFQVGAVFRWKGVRISYTMVRRSPEFEGQRDPHQFAALSLTVRY